MSDTMTEGVIVAWHKKVGDSIKSGDLLAEVETDKATMELESYNNGTLLYIGIEAGKSVPVDGIIAVIGKAGEAFENLIANNSTATNTTTEAAKPTITAESNTVQNTTPNIDISKMQEVVLMPRMSDTMSEGVIAAWHKKIGDQVKSGELLAEVETDKATMELESYVSGTLLYIGVEAGGKVPVNQLLCIIGDAAKVDVNAIVAASKNTNTATESTTNIEPTTTNNTNTVVDTSNDAQNNDGRVKISPLAKKLAAEKGISLNAIAGSGDGGRIIKKDIDNYQPASAAPAANATTTAPSATTQIVSGVEGHTDTQLTQMRKVIARRLGESKFSAPHFYLTIEVIMDNAMTSRTAMNAISPVKISFNDMIIKASAMALRKHPDVNSSFMGDFIRHNHHIHIGSAVAMPDGLIVPVIRFADNKSLSQIAADANQLYAKAKDKKLQPNEFSGNTFTISNLGMMGIEEFTAIINPPDSAILAVGGINEKVIKKGDGFGITNVMKLTLSCDHRSIDGAVGASFLQTLKSYLENPVTMLV
jgi:pyruvate dehydrogenase E2 component (dihydrolipoamide acetyltransferase)